MCRPIGPNEVWGIKILDNRHQPWFSQFQHVLLNTSHPIFTKGELCPVTAKCGYPLLIYSDSIHGGLPAQEDNQPAVYLRIEPHDGFAPMQCVYIVVTNRLLGLTWKPSPPIAGR